MELVKLLAALAAIGVSSVSATGSRVVRNPDKVQARDGLQSPSTLPVPNSPTSQGCFSSGGNMTKVNVQYLASGSCIKACLDSDYWVAGLHGDQCLCGFAYPPSKSRTKEDSDCNYPCPYWKVEACGGLGDGHGGPSYYSIFNTGLNISASFYSPPKSSTGHSSTATSSSSSQSTSTSESTTDPAATTTGDASSSASATSDPDKDNNNSGGTNVGAIAGGIVAGVVVIAAAIAGGFFYLRKKRYAEIEEEHRRNAAVNAFISGSQPPSTSGSISMTDSRLDPVMAHRRMSDGSIADNQDYSRRILRVTNA